MFLGYIKFAAYSVCTVCATCNVISPVKYVLSFYISTSRITCAVPNMAVFFFGSSLMSFSPVMLFRYFLSDFEMVLLAPLFTGITFAFTFHKR